MDKQTIFTSVALLIVVALLTFVYFSSLEQVKVCQEANDKIDSLGCAGYCSMIIQGRPQFNFTDLPFESIVETNYSQDNP